MTRRSRRLLATVVCAGLFGVSGCALGGTDPGSEQNSPEPQPKASGLKDLDPCAFFTPDDLAAAGVGGAPERVEDVSFEPGCSFEGESAMLTLYKNQDETVGSYATHGNWDSYQKFDINGRAAATGVSAGATDRGICNVLVDAGGGVAIVTVNEIFPGGIPDPCGEAEKIARQVEPRLPH
ncbi:MULTISPECIES: DUF3558 domain-containing protein [unclassified Saccharopolyspora]|uniref:DUF3558 domain-containing protein n=2 Tax=Saccharopolyspora TaxID=1835 RepID=UPI001CD72643|nr:MULTISPECIES: DUF3558 domain-containing protein [unclassified Saccharopolyspora]MCA1195897.1 DUF3558 domain-containing protein [Saccharopolyspora sp. 6V]MCA1283613.1 DUF3558 domain-containing protein [Saccharopolyspora sp. 7B]